MPVLVDTSFEQNRDETSDDGLTDKLKIAGSISLISALTLHSQTSSRADVYDRVSWTSVVQQAVEKLFGFIQRFRESRWRRMFYNDERTQNAPVLPV